MIIKPIPLYENRDDVTLTSYVLDDSPELLGEEKRPAIIICPGGGYLFCSDREAEPVALRFAAMGYQAFVLRYSTYHQGNNPGIGNEGKMEPNPDSMYPAPMRDIGKAFLILRSHAEEWRIDTNRIAICGFSAGAHNCSMYAVNWHKPVIHEFFGEDPAVFKPVAVILGYGIQNYHLMMDPSDNLSDPMASALRRSAAMAYFGTESPDKAQLDIASPVFHVCQKTPPCFLWATTEDDLVPVQNTCEMSTALAEAGVPFEVHIYEKGPHGLSLANQASASSKFEMNSIAAGWIDAVERWLETRLSLPVRDKPFWMEQLEADAIE